MATVTKKDLVDRIADKLQLKQNTVREVVQEFLAEIVHELDHGHRLEFRDFGIFEVRSRAARLGWNPRTLARVPVPDKRKVRFRPGRLLKARLANPAPMEDGRIRPVPPTTEANSGLTNSDPPVTKP
ncbi:MAG: HU family DNA-binding protein [Phycisphaerae bacterium]|nr:HU family DNA-binding protein [Phycisphaerae bacterium]